MKVGLFFGSFNPVHNGHLIVAQAVLDDAELDEIWFVVSPHNPLKDSKSLIHEFDRIDMVELAIEGNDRFKASNVEFSMPKPSYTIDTLTYLTDKHPAHEFHLIIGEDNLKYFHKWKNYQSIATGYPIVVYNRPGVEKYKTPEITELLWVEAPLIHISATYIRKKVRHGKSIDYLVPHKVARFISDRKLYLD